MKGNKGKTKEKDSKITQKYREIKMKCTKDPQLENKVKTNEKQRKNKETKE